MKKIILFLNLFLVFNLGFSLVKGVNVLEYHLKYIQDSKNNTPVKGGYIDGKWYAWYDGTFLGKEEIKKERFHKFKTLEVDVVGVEMEYGRDVLLETDDELLEAGRVLKYIHLKVTDFKLTDINGNVYTKDNYPNEQNKTFIPIIMTDKTINNRLIEDDKYLKFIGSEKKNIKTGRTVLDIIPTKLILNNDNGFDICATPNGKKLYYSRWGCDRFE